MNKKYIQPKLVVIDLDVTSITCNTTKDNVTDITGENKEEEVPVWGEDTEEGHSTRNFGKSAPSFVGDRPIF